MNFNYLRLFISFMLVLIFLNGCAEGQFANKNFKHDTPLIKEDIRKRLAKYSRLATVILSG